MSRALVTLLVGMLMFASVVAVVIIVASLIEAVFRWRLTYSLVVAVIVVLFVAVAFVWVAIPIRT